MNNVEQAVRDEITRQHELHGARAIGSKAMTDIERLGILMEEVGEVARCVNDQWLHATRSKMKVELVQVAACAQAWLDIL